jgi:hypothetical protein
MIQLDRPLVVKPAHPFRALMLSSRNALGSALCLIGITGTLDAADPASIASSPPGRVFAASRYSVDQILTRPFDRDVPMGCTGDRVWASSPQGWAFRDDIHWINATRIEGFDVEIRDEHGLLEPTQPTYYPSHVHYQAVTRKEMTARASFTFARDSVDNPLSPPFVPQKRWTCWSSGNRRDWYEVELGVPRSLIGFDLLFFDDAPSGGCRPPHSFRVEYFGDGRWQGVQLTRIFPERPRPGENRVRFEPLRCARFRLILHHAGNEFYTGLYGVLPVGADSGTASSPPSPLEFTCDKFITATDRLVSTVRVHNPTTQVRTIYVEPLMDCASVRDSWTVESHSGMLPAGGGGAPGREPRSLSLTARQWLGGLEIDSRLRYAVIDQPPVELRVAAGGTASGIKRGVFVKPWFDHPDRDVYKRFGHRIQPGKTKVFKAALELRPENEASRIDSVLVPAHDRAFIIKAADQDARDLLATQVREYQSWYDANLPFFDCSDAWVRKMYYHRAYVLHGNMLDPRLGRMRWPTQSEGRWRSTWYPNVISYGAAHQVREARWLRDPKYWQGHLRTWAENEKSDGVYPSHVTADGPAGGQYTDWISSTAWDGELVHPDQAFLAEVVEKLARNVRGWQKQCDPDGDGLLEVDSHWWTGMEYQPSFFFFSDYKVSKNFDQPARQVSLARVDLTAYSYGNAVAVARIHRRLGQQQKAQEFEQLAARIARAVTTKMWRPGKGYFYSLRASDLAVAGVKEVVGVYPFYFGMVPWGKGYESAWASIVDPEQLWSAWPVASASRECPAYSQTNWPGDGRAAGCMWNGPTWPHANSLVLTAMARTLRAARDHQVLDLPLKRSHLWELFVSFTKAQFRGQNLAYPWTGEFYNGDDGTWKTAERDYNHSTWLDVLIPDLLGVVPRDDDVLEIDPLLPGNGLSYFILDGLRYHGRDVTIAWDAPLDGSPDRFGDGRKGLDVYVGGRRVASSAQLARLAVGLATGRPVEIGSGSNSGGKLSAER